MGAIQAMDNIYYVGVQDKDLRVFDIIMHSDYGTSYNSYLVRGSEKTALFETCKLEFWDEYIANIREVCDPSEIDYIVVNHTEPDHAGCMERILELAPNAKVLGSSTALTFLKEIVNHPFASQAVTEADQIDLGGLTLTFLSVPFLHWPDSMYTYIPELKALFSCDSFGCHYADDRVFNDLIEGDFTDAYLYYFTHIIGPFKRPFMTKALDKIAALDIQFIGNGHGPVLRSNIQKYLDMYREWCAPQPKNGKDVVIAYVSAYGYTRSLAEAIAKGVQEAGVDVKVFDLVTDSAEEAKAAIADADGFLLGSPTLVGDALPPIYEMMMGLNPIIHRGKFAGAFGSYGWSGEAVPNLVARMQQLKLSMPLEGMKIRFKPTQQDLDNAVSYGKQFAEAVLAK
ncbi:MAG TPA: FprA family A-type flavoprotein [Candidatus Ruthenibacterium avium]|uniref:FprA family A-type flavoprotein n=1 Tax=Candidatus Ruthenibacterium avium TaxID=2838751 RepID=A0A9D2M267_9FIRM|nr:FprA family A-type flavoprotein [Candidatus Ruthenibacterium avium]